MEVRNSTRDNSAVRAAQVREELDRILADAAFSGAIRRSRLLRFLVEEQLEDRGELLKESVIATEVFDRAPGYDPQIDSVVRVETSRLRTRLAGYYAKAGSAYPVRIELPKGSYRPVFEFRQNAPAEGPAEGSRRDWRRIAAGAATVLLVLGGFAYWRLRIGTTSLQSIAILPFLNLSGNPGDEYLGDGVADELTEALAESNGLRVVARTSAFEYKGRGADVREIGRRLGAAAILEGSVARHGSQVHLVAQLIRASDGYHLWSHTYDGSMSDLSGIESGIAQATRGKLGAAAPPGDASSKPVNADAHDLYIRAVYAFNQRTLASTRQAMELARQAVEKDRSFAQPWVLMAYGESQLTTLMAEAPDVAAKHASEDVANALALDPGNSGAHAQKALMAYTDQWDWPQAEREFRLALSNGSRGSAENLYGWCLITRGRFAEARRHLQAAAELDPLSLGPQLNQVTELLAEHNDAEAKRRIDEILRVAPPSLPALALGLSVAYWQKDCASATAMSQKIVTQFYRGTGPSLANVPAAIACGDAGKAAVTLAANARAPSAFLSPYAAADIFAIGNEGDRAIALLQFSADRREPALMQLKVDRAFDALHQDPRFIALERRLGLRE